MSPLVREPVLHASRYSSPSAFISAFRRELGTTPGPYFAESS